MRHSAVRRRIPCTSTPRRRGSGHRDGGLSEIVAVGQDRLAVIERDKLNGPNAKVKRVYTVDIPSKDPASGTLPVLRKKLAHDVLPDLRATKGWTQEKLEGLTIGGDGQVYAITDNDALADATGETVSTRFREQAVRHDQVGGGAGRPCCSGAHAGGPSGSPWARMPIFTWGTVTTLPGGGTARKILNGWPLWADHRTDTIGRC